MSVGDKVVFRGWHGMGGRRRKVRQVTEVCGGYFRWGGHLPWHRAEDYEKVADDSPIDHSIER